MRQTNKFLKGSIFHICNKSIANFGIFKDKVNIRRVIYTLDYYNSHKTVESLSDFLSKKRNRSIKVDLLSNKKRILKFIAYCIMPDHYHILVKILTNGILSKYIGDVENSFTRFFNNKFNRKGPLWQSRFRSVEIKTDEQLLHVSRYIHLNPTTDYLVDKPEDWEFSSYKYYINNNYYLQNVFNEITINNAQTYKKFCEDQIDYQRNLKRIKKLILE